MENLAYYNGRVTGINQMQIPANDRGFYFGDGIYEVALVHHHNIFALQEHLDRFFMSAEKVRIALPFSQEELVQILMEQVKKIDSPSQFLYWQVTRATAPRQHVFPEDDVLPNLYITIKPDGRKDFKQEYDLTTTEDIRGLFCDVKTLNLLPNILAAQKAAEGGFQETVFIRDGYVTEAAHSNVSIVKDGIFLTHPADEKILHGIERGHLIRYCRELGVPVQEKVFTLEDLKAAEEIIISSTSGACMRAVKLEGQPVGGKNLALVEKLREKYLEDLEEQTDR